MSAEWRAQDPAPRSLPPAPLHPRAGPRGYSGRQLCGWAQHVSALGPSPAQAELSAP